MKSGHSRQWYSLSLGDEEFIRFRDLIARKVGLLFDSSRRDSLEDTLKDRMRQLGIASFGEYYHYINGPRGQAEFDELASLITIPETFFFRDQAQLIALRRFVVPELLAKRPENDRVLRIWSAGCSSGEEPYSIAMLFALELSGIPPPYILATDISTRALELARVGVYRERALRNIPEVYRHRFFRQEGRLFFLDDELKGKVEFRRFNLVDKPYPCPEGGWDVIFCRNVIMYFHPEVRRQVVDRLHRSLRQGGYLFTGFAESLRYISDAFATVQLGGVFLYKKDGRAAGKSQARQRRPKPPSRKARRPKPILAKAEEEPPWNKVRQLLEQAHFEEARRLLAPLVAGDSAPLEAMLLQSEVALNQGELQEAESWCSRALESDALSFDANLLAAFVCRSKNDLERARNYLRRALYLRPDHALARFHLAEVYVLSGELQMAQREYGAALRLLESRPESFDDRFAGGFSAALLASTCRNRLEALERETEGPPH